MHWRSDSFADRGSRAFTGSESDGGLESEIALGLGIGIFHGHLHHVCAERRTGHGVHDAASARAPVGLARVIGEYLRRPPYPGDRERDRYRLPRGSIRHCDDGAFLAHCSEMEWPQTLRW